MLKAIASHALDLLFPRSCLITGEPVSPGRFRYLSESALADITFIEEPFCKTCGSPFYGLAEPWARCSNCRATPFEFSAGRSAFLAKDAGRAIVHELKYHAGHYLLPDIAELVRHARGMDAFLEGAVLVPVPLHERKLRERGFNQSQLIAGAVAKLGFGNTVLNALQRVRDTQTQTHLSREKRQANVKNAFALRPEITLDGAQCYILVDDVCTTGATLNACAAALAAKGAINIRIFTLAHG